MIFVILDTAQRFNEGQSTRFENIKRLIELHWLDGVPLWGCLTGLYSDRDIGPLEDWLYSVRQIVALYRCDYAAWKEETITYCDLSSFFERRQLFTVSSPSIEFTTFLCPFQYQL